MAQKTTHTKELCAVCGEDLKKTTISHDERRGANFYLFQHVPAQVCTACGEIWIDEATLQEIDRLIRQGQPTRKAEMPVYDFTFAGTKSPNGRSIQTRANR